MRCFGAHRGRRGAGHSVAASRTACCLVFLVMLGNDLTRLPGAFSGQDLSVMEDPGKLGVSTKQVCGM